VLAADGRKALHRGDFPGAATILAAGDGAVARRHPGRAGAGTSVRAKTEAFDEQRRCLELDWISARLALGDHAEMLAVLRELTVERPLDEGLWRHLTVTLYSMGRTAEALSAYAQARRHLVTELGIEPGPELQKVQAAILRRDDVPDVPAPRAATAPGWRPDPPAVAGRQPQLHRPAAHDRPDPPAGVRTAIRGQAPR